MTIGEIIDEVITQVGGDTDDTDLADKLLVDAKSALRRFPVFIKTGLARATKSGSLTAAATTMTKPAGIVSIIGDAWFENAGVRLPIIQKKNIDSFRPLYRGSSTGQPQYFHEPTFGTIEFDRKADQTRTIYFPCLIDMDDVTASTEWNFPSSDIEILKDGIKMGYYDTEEDGAGESSAKFERRFLAGLKKLDERYMRENYPDYIEECE